MEGLETLQAGDDVAIYGHYGAPRLTKVLKRTQQHLVVASLGNGAPVKYRLTSGASVSGTVWHKTYAKPVTQAVRDAIEREKLVNNLKGTLWECLSLEQLRAVNQALNARTA